MAAIGRVLLIPKGDYSGSTAYNALDWVRDNGAAWVCKLDDTIGVAPPTLPTTSNANWQLLSADGTVSGSVAWSAVNNKPFDTIDSSDFDVDANSELNIKRGTYSKIKVGQNLLMASGADMFELLAGSNITLVGDDTTNPKSITINSTGGGGGGSSTFAGLTDTDINNPQPDEIVQYKAVGGVMKLQNVTMPQGGHTMLPNPASSPAPTEADCISAINTAVAAGPTNDNVASEYTIGKWSNAYEKLAIVKATSAHPIGTSGIGTWQDNIDPSNPPSKADEQGWGWIEWSALHGIGSENVDVKLSFDPDKCSTPIILGGYIIDDVNDMMCIKFGNQISSADTETAWVGIKIIVTRTAATEITP